MRQGLGAPRRGGQSHGPPLWLLCGLLLAAVVLGCAPTPDTARDLHDLTASTARGLPGLQSRLLQYSVTHLDTCTVRVDFAPHAVEGSLFAHWATLFDQGPRGRWTHREPFLVKTIRPEGLDIIEIFDGISGEEAFRGVEKLRRFLDAGTPAVIHGNHSLPPHRVGRLKAVWRPWQIHCQQVVESEACDRCRVAVQTDQDLAVCVETMDGQELGTLQAWRLPGEDLAVSTVGCPAALP